MPALVDLDLPNVFDPNCGCDGCVTHRAALDVLFDECREMWVDMLEADLSLDQDVVGSDGTAFDAAVA